MGMNVTYDVKCERCGAKVGEAEFPEPLTDRLRIIRCETGCLCEACTLQPAPPEQPPEG